jgi:hypothetical protein
MFQFSVGGSSAFSIYRSTNSSFVGALMFEFGSAGLTSRMRVRTGGGVGVNFDGIIGVASLINFGVSTGTGSGDLQLQRDAADTLALVRGTAGQTFRLYNTFTDANNHERGFLRWSSNVFQIGTEAGSGGGTARAVEIRQSVDNNWGFSVFRSTTRIFGFYNNDGYVGASSVFGWDGRLRLSAPSDGVFLVANNTANGFGRLQFGGTTSSFPSLKRSTTSLQARLADDSAFTAIQGKLTTETAYTAGAPSATGYLVLYDSNGAAYKVPAEAL